MTDTMRPMATRLCASTIKERRASFNQVALESDIPDRVVLVGIDKEAGVRVWVRKYSDIASLTREQHSGYSRHLGPFDVDDAPAELGRCIDIPADWFPEGVWATLTSASTNTLHKAAEDALRVVFGLS
jgi:hypothetical protein